MLKRPLPEGVHVLPDGSWRVGDLPISQARRLRYLKQRIAFEDTGVFLVDGHQRVPLVLDGPPFQVEGITLDGDRGEIRIRLDDGGEELLETPIQMNPETGQFECRVKGGRARAALALAAHDTLLDALEQEGGEFFIPLGNRRARVLP